MEDYSKIELYKKSNAELAANLGEKRIEIREISERLMRRTRELQVLHEENARLKIEATKQQETIKRWQQIVIETIRANTSQYATLMRSVGITVPGQQAPPASAQSQPAQTNTNTAAVNTLHPIQSNSSHQISSIDRANSPNHSDDSNDDEPAYPNEQFSFSPSPFGLSNVAEENTLDLQSSMEHNSFLSNATNSMFSSTMLTTPNIQRDENSPIIYKNTIDSVTKPLSSTENIMHSSKKKGKKSKEKDKSISISSLTDNSPIIRRRATSEPPTPTQSDINVSRRPRRKAAPNHQLVEQPLNTKMRRK